jgi:two-component SAPR family response regulator
MKGNQGILNLKIITLGNFDIRNGQKSLLENVSKRSYRVFDLLKLFVTFKDKKLLPETILERLLPENELQDPKNALRTQISR